MFPAAKSFVVVVLVALLGACVVSGTSPAAGPAAAAAASAGSPQASPADAKSLSGSVGLTAILGCMWEEDAAECLRLQSARALEEVNNGEVEEPTFLEVLREGSARVLELFSEDEASNAVDTEATDSDSHVARAADHAEQGRKKVKIPKLGGKKGKKGGGLLQTLYMLKTMFSVLVTAKVTVLSFLLQIKSFFVSLILVSIAVIQFIWKLQERKSQGSWQTYGEPAAHAHSAHASDSYGGSGGWDKRSATATAAAAGILTDPLGSAINAHEQAFRGQRPL